MSKSLYHWGVLGMHWGVRNSDIKTFSSGKKNINSWVPGRHGTAGKTLHSSPVMKAKTKDLTSAKKQRGKEIVGLLLVSAFATAVIVGSHIYNNSPAGEAHKEKMLTKAFEKAAKNPNIYNMGKRVNDMLK
jgi:hypothetical protein